jgi:Protein of unknown function (DUF429)
LILAVDWSGRDTRTAESIWLAEAADGRLIDLEGGWSRDEVVDEVIARAGDATAVVGLDFAFSFPGWWCQEQGWSTGRDVWQAAAREGETWLKACTFPFWGRPTKRNEHDPDRLYRSTDREVPAGSPKSVFQIGGAGAVGTGSIRGMPYLLKLAEAGFSIWPFDEPGNRSVVEIYPRALTGPVNKGSWRARHRHLFEHFGDQDGTLLERAAGSEDAFDAAVSAIVMSRHLPQLVRTTDPDYRIEGQIWVPAES